MLRERSKQRIMIPQYFRKPLVIALHSSKILQGAGVIYLARCPYWKILVDYFFSFLFFSFFCLFFKFMKDIHEGRFMKEIHTDEASSIK